MNTSVNICGKLPAGLVEMYQLVETQADELSIDFLVVGAMARDLVLHYGFEATIERGTRDVDFAIQVDGWNTFNALKSALLSTGMTKDNTLFYRLGFQAKDGLPWELDILPFGAITDKEQDLNLPPDGEIKMSMLGFPEALDSAWKINIAEQPTCIIQVANPAAIVLLKMVAWTERDSQLRRKDALDVAYIIRSYEKIPAMYAQLYDGGFAEACDYDLEQASAMLLGKQISDLASAQTAEYIQSHFTQNTEAKRTFIRDMDTVNAEQWFDRLIENFQGTAE